MGKKTPAHTPKLRKKFYPLVSICTPTFNRRPFIPIMFECFKNQTYPRDRMEWIIVDDGTDKIQDLIASSGISQIKYYPIETKMALGAKRNLMHSYAKGGIIVYMDDDDYYPPERVTHAVDRLTENREALCAGSSEIYVYFKHIQKMYQCGPYGPNHATAGTFAFRAELLNQTRYDEGACLAEEKAFLKNYTIPFVQLDPIKTILVFSHEHNTFDKRKLLEQPKNDFFKESAKTVAQFIRKPEEGHIVDFFMRDIDGLLANYAPGESKMKPDVLKQIEEITKEREKMATEEQEKQMNRPSGITVQNPDGTRRELTQREVANTIQQQHQMIQDMNKKVGEMEEVIANLQRQILMNCKKETKVFDVGSKSEPEIIS